MGGIGPEEADPKIAASAAGDDGIENLPPVIGTVDVTVSQGTSFQHSERVAQQAPLVAARDAEGFLPRRRVIECELSSDNNARRFQKPRADMLFRGSCPELGYEHFARNFFVVAPIQICSIITSTQAVGFLNSSLAPSLVGHDAVVNPRKHCIPINLSFCQKRPDPPRHMLSAGAAPDPARPQNPGRI